MRSSVGRVLAGVLIAMAAGACSETVSTTAAVPEPATAAAVFTPAPASDDLADAMTAEMTDEQLAAVQATAAALATPTSVEDVGLAKWWPDHERIVVDAPILPILVTELACTSGQNAEGRIRVQLDETADLVQLRVWVTPLEVPEEFEGENFGWNCQGVAPTSYDVPLQAPLGDRAIIDDVSGAAAASPTAEPPRPDPMVLQNAEQLADGIVVSESIGTAANVPLNLICPAPSAPVARWAPSIPGGAEFALPTEALALTLGETDLPAESFHLYAEASVEGERSPHVFVQFLDGAPVTLVFAEGGTVGYQLTAEWCDGLPAGWQPDAEKP